MTERMDVNRLLLEMRSLKSQSQAFGGPGALAGKDVAQGIGQGIGQGPNSVQNANAPKFSALMGQAVNAVNDVQQASAATGQAFIKGDPSVDVTEVMIAGQKASVAFDSMVQVRNKLVEAYKDVMNMPI